MSAMVDRAEGVRDWRWSKQITGRMGAGECCHRIQSKDEKEIDTRYRCRALTIYVVRKAWVESFELKRQSFDAAEGTGRGEKESAQA